MAKEMAQARLREFALVGARTRYEELQREQAQLLKAFPELGRGRARAAQPAKSAAKRRRRKMSAAERKAVADRMRKYWAERRKQKGEK